MDGASEKEKTEKKGQQQWGLFETNYQRNKGITTDQSLNEIEQFCANGVKVNSGGEQWSIKGDEHATVVNRGAGGQGGFGGQGGQGGFGAQGGFGGQGGQGGFGAQGGVRAPGSGTLQFNDKTDAGAAFFAQHKANDAKKYQPERKW